MKKTILFLFAIITFITSLSAQRIEGRLNLSDTTQVHQLTLTDGGVMVGRLIAMHAETWEFKYSGKTEQIPTNKIERLKVLNKGKTDGDNDVIVMEPANPTNNGNSEVIVSPTAIPLKKGEAYYETIWGYYHYMEYGLGKGFSIGAGGAIPILATRLRWGMPLGKLIHVGISDTNYSSFGVVFNGSGSQSNVGFGGLGTLGILSGNLAIGKTNRYINIGAGTSYILTTEEGYMSGSSLPIISVGGALPIGKRWALLSDNIILPVSQGNNSAQLIFPSIACRYFNKKIRVDAGFWTIFLNIGNNGRGSSPSNSNSYFPIPIPYLSFAANINTKHLK